MKRIEDLNYKDAERAKTLTAVLRTLRKRYARMDREEQEKPQTRVTTLLTRLTLMKEDIETAQRELDALLDDRLPSEEIGG